MTVCDVVLHEGREIVPNVNGGTKIIEITPTNVQHACLSCKHYVTYGYGVYCVRTPYWKGHTHKYETTARKQ